MGFFLYQSYALAFIHATVEISKQRELEQKQREFFSAASHELKTPLTILKGHLTGMLNKVKGYENREVYMERSLAVVEKMETLVKELLYLSKTDESQKSEYKMIDLAELLRVQIADVTELLSEKELSLTVDIPDKLLCEVDSAQMERALQNIFVIHQMARKSIYHYQMRKIRISFFVK